MGKKYIIEIPEDKIADFVGSTHFLMPYMMAGHIGHHDTGLPIKPYTEPNIEQVRKEAYDKGYDDATAKIGSDEQAIAEKAYQRGLNDAWEAARKVTQVRKYGGYGDCLEEVFGRHRAPWDVFDYSASEAIEKIRQYEHEKEMDGLRQNIQTIVDQCGYSLDEIAEVLQKMRES